MTTNRFTATFHAETWKHLLRAVFSERGKEGAAFVLCRSSTSSAEFRFLAREVVPVSPAQYRVREPFGLSITSEAYVHIAKRAALTGSVILFVHSHPNGVPDFSEQDDREDPKLHAFFEDHVPGVHGSLVISAPDLDRALSHDQVSVIGRVWTGRTWLDITRIRVFGGFFRFFDAVRSSNDQRFFDRQIRAFGSELQGLLQRLHIGVVGVGGTGSAVTEQLTRLGVGRLTIWDGDVFDPSNVNRVYGSSTRDESLSKTTIAARLVSGIGLGTKVLAIDEPIDLLSSARRLTACDIVFGCTDNHASRAILSRLATRYLIPVLDLGVLIDSDEGKIRDVTGRVTTYFPGYACAFCRGRITPDRIAAEGLGREERIARAKEGYAPELDNPAPSVIPFTSGIASAAVMEFLQRLTGFMGSSTPSEVLLRFDSREISTNEASPNPSCQCADRHVWGRGDESQFLGRSWPVARHHELSRPVNSICES